MKWILILSVFTLLNACIQDKVSCERDYIFDIGVDLEEAKDTFIIGDTLLLSMEFSKMLTDELSGESFDASTFSLNTTFSIARIDTDPASCTGNLFDLIEMVGEMSIVQLSGNCISIFVNYFEMEEVFVFSFGFIPEKNGLYAFGFNSDFFNTKLPQLVEGCETKELKVLYNLNTKGGDSNYHFQALSPDELYQNFTIEQFNSAAGFSFYVE